MNNQKERPEIEPIRVPPADPPKPEVDPKPEKKEPPEPSPEIPIPEPEVIPGKE